MLCSRDLTITEVPSKGKKGVKSNYTAYVYPCNACTKIHIALMLVSHLHLSACGVAAVFHSLQGLLLYFTALPLPKRCSCKPAHHLPSVWHSQYGEGAPTGRLL